VWPNVDLGLFRQASLKPMNSAPFCRPHSTLFGVWTEQLGGKICLTGHSLAMHRYRAYMSTRFR
jgi:hypothetical protein